MYAYEVWLYDKLMDIILAASPEAAKQLAVQLYGTKVCVQKA